MCGAFSHRARPSDARRHLGRLLAFCAVAMTATLALSLAQTAPAITRTSSYEFPAFRLVWEEHVEGRHVATFQLDWRGLNDWTETVVWSTGGVAPGPRQEARDGRLTSFANSESVSYPLQDGSSAHVPGVWFRDFSQVVMPPPWRATVDGTSRIIRLTTPTDAEEWEADIATGIPVGYRQVVSGVVVRESRVVSLVLADGSVIR